jgi:dienelactone hydrolase
MLAKNDDGAPIRNGCVYLFDRQAARATVCPIRSVLAVRAAHTVVGLMTRPALCSVLLLASLVSCSGEPLTPSAAGGSLYNADDSDAGAADLRCQADANTPQRTDYAQPGPFQVSQLDLTFDDTSRPIAATDKHAAAPSRKLVTTIYYPSTGITLLGPERVADGGPFPLLMYSHGYSSSREAGAAIASHAASYGYIVVAPDFPLTNMLANDGAPDIEDTHNQPGDVSFLIDQMLALSADPSQLFAGAVDETRIGAVGLSLGGLTTLLVTYHPELHDERIKVAVPIAAPSSFFAQGFYHTRAVPTLLIHGDIDAFINYEANARRSLIRAAPNARLVSVANGTHAAFGAQMDQATTAALNALLAPQGAHPTNPDGLGCGAVGATLQMTRGAFLESLGGPENFIEPDPDPAASVPCLGDEYTLPALDSYEQNAIAVQGALAFFEAYFASSAETRTDGCRYLLHELTKQPAVKLE